MAIEISRMTMEDIPGVVECVQRAFEDDPYFQWVFDATKVCVLLGLSRTNVEVALIGFESIRVPGCFS